MYKWNPHVTRETFPKDFLASLVVFLMALPLCMGIALASGVPAELGLITGIIGGCVVGFLTGSPLQVSGPAAGLTVLVYEIVNNHGVEALAVIVLTAGVLQILMGVLSIGQIFRSVSPAVVNGMMSGIGITLILSQMYIIAGLHPKAEGLENIQHFPQLVSHLFEPGGVGPISVGIGALTIFILYTWKEFTRGKFAAIPAPLVAVTVCTAITAFANLPIKHVALPDNIFSAVKLTHIQAVGHMDLWEVARFAVALAIVASAETLLSAAAVDKLHRGPRTKYDKELIAQGIGNSLCGLVGSLPMTGVIARSSVNVMAGAKTNHSAIMHGFWLLIAVAALPSVLRLVPIASLAALLLFTGIKLINVEGIKKLWGFGPRLVAIYAATAIAIVATDLLMGVLIGVVLSIVKLLYTMARLKVEIESIDNKSILHLRGAATFLSLPKLADALDNVPANTELHVCMDELDYVDHSCLELIMDWEKQHESTGGTLVMDWGELHAMFRSKRRARPVRTFLHHPAETHRIHIVTDAESELERNEEELEPAAV